MNINEFIKPIEYHKELNPKIWERNHRLKNEVRSKLLQIAEDFKNYIDVPFTVVDIVITGGNANYNYTNHSDIDLHLIADFDSVDCDREAAELFDTKRLLYKNTYDISIYGIPVELYVENKDEPAVSGGSYSILKNEWKNTPSDVLPQYDELELQNMIAVWKKLISRAVRARDLNAARTVLMLLRKYRKLGLKTPEAEFSIPNLVFKSLRNNQTTEKLMQLINDLHDNELSIG